MTSLRNLTLMVAGIGAILTISTAQTARAAAVPNGAWKGRGELGVVLNRGNVNTDSANAKVDLKETAGLWSHELYVAGIYGRGAGQLTAENLDARWQSNYALGRSFAFGTARDLIDKFSGFEYQASVSAGMGYKLVDQPRMKLSAQIGLGLLRQRSQLLQKDSAGVVTGRFLFPAHNSAAVIGGVNFERDFFTTSKVTDVLTVTSGGGNTAIRNNAELQIKMSTALALGLGFTIQHNSTTPRGSVSTDTISTINLVYAF